MARRAATGALAALLSLLVAALVLEAAVRAFDLFAAERTLTGGGDGDGGRQWEPDRPGEPGPLDGEGPGPGGPDGARGPALRNRLHPYLAWSRRPGSTSPLVYWSGAIPLAADGDPGEWFRRSARANRHGYYSPFEDYAALPASRFVVGVFGGSVADQLVLLGGEALRAALAERLGEADVVVLNVGSAGYKQPQQLLALLELAMLGVPFDLVVNVDGFNEVVFGAADAQRGRHPLFPSRRHWSLTVELASALPSPERLELWGAVARERRRAREWAERVSEGAAAWSELARAAGGALARRHRARAAALEAELQERAAEGSAGAEVLAELPDPCPGGGARCFELVADLWERSSLAMHAAARGIGARYLHVLQPNQYLEGTKPLSDAEREHAWRPTPQSQLVREGYPHLQRRGLRLRQRGVAFHDLTGAFREREETLYRDVCCHYTQDGNELLARVIAGLAAELRMAATRHPAPGAAPPGRDEVPR